MILVSCAIHVHIVMHMDTRQSIDSWGTVDLARQPTLKSSIDRPAHQEVCSRSLVLALLMAPRYICIFIYTLVQNQANFPTANSLVAWLADTGQPEMGEARDWSAISNI
jgi:hypothetical protein